MSLRECRSASRAAGAEGEAGRKLANRPISGLECKSLPRSRAGLQGEKVSAPKFFVPAPAGPPPLTFPDLPGCSRGRDW